MRYVSEVLIVLACCGSVGWAERQPWEDEPCFGTNTEGDPKDCFDKFGWQNASDCVKIAIKKLCITTLCDGADQDADATLPCKVGGKATLCTTKCQVQDATTGYSLNVLCQEDSEEICDDAEEAWMPQRSNNCACRKEFTGSVCMNELMYACKHAHTVSATVH